METLLKQLLKANPPKSSEVIKTESERLIGDIQALDKLDGTEEMILKLSNKLFNLHVTLVMKVYNQMRGKMVVEPEIYGRYIIDTDFTKLNEGDVVYWALEIMPQAALKYDVDKGHDRFTWVGFYMRRLTWKLQEQYFRNVGPVYVPRKPLPRDFKISYCDHEDLNFTEDIEEALNIRNEHETYPDRWKAAYDYEVNLVNKTDDDELDLKFFKLNYKNKNIHKLSRHLGIPTKRIQLGISRTEERMTEFYRNLF